MRNKTISVSEELFELLKKEDNASNLISNLLRDYYDNLRLLECNIIEKESVINVMEQSVKECDKQELNERVREAILKEIKEQDKNENITQ